MSLPKTVWTFSADEFTKLIDAEIEARLSPWTDGNRSLRIRFLYKLGHHILCSTPEKVNEILADWQRLKSITSQQIPGLSHGTDKKEQVRQPFHIEGFKGREKSFYERAVS